MDKKEVVINDQFVKLSCMGKGEVPYIAYVRIGSISGIIDNNSRCIVITPERRYQTTSTFTQLSKKLKISISK